MKNLSSINENELDGVLNTLFLETYSHVEDERLARFILDQEYDHVMTEKKETKLLRKLSVRRGGLFLLLALIGIIATIVLTVYFSSTDKHGDTHFPVAAQPDRSGLNPENIANSIQNSETPGQEQGPKMAGSVIMTPTSAANISEMVTVTDTLTPVEPDNRVRKEVVAENSKKPLPYFDEPGLLYFQTVKADLLAKIRHNDEQFYTKIDPGATMYKNREILVAPFVMSNFPVTNLQYKAFLADLFTQGKMKDFENCLPKQEVWKKYGCSVLAENYFYSESYNYFPVVNINKDAIQMFCKWIEEEVNKSLVEPHNSVPKAEQRKKEVIARLPYDYEWIYAADASYAIIPDCSGYNTIYDPSEGLVNTSFYKRTSKLSKFGKNKINRIDKLNDLNRFGMPESEMIAIYKEAMRFSRKKRDPYQYQKMEDCCLAGHVVELINTREGGNTLRGCCWKNKEEYLEMANGFKKFEASPFVGFRIMFVTKNGTYKEPFW